MRGQEEKSGSWSWANMGLGNARILLNRLSTHITPEVVPETQSCFRGNQSTDHCIWYLLTSVRRSIQLEDRATAATEEVWLPREVHNNDRGSTYRNDGEC